MDIADLRPGMILKGTVRNIVDFGAFVDIGVHQDGLVHISRMTDRFINHPLEVVSVGDIVEVEVVEIDEKKQRIGLSMLIGKSTADKPGTGKKAAKKESPSDDKTHGKNRGRKQGDGADRRRPDGRRPGKHGQNGDAHGRVRSGEKGSFGSSLGDLLANLEL